MAMSAEAALAASHCVPPCYAKAMSWADVYDEDLYESVTWPREPGTFMSIL